MTSHLALQDLYAPSAPGSLMRSYPVPGARPGRFRLARRDCELYSVQIISAGAWGRVRVIDGEGTELWMQPSTFTGSFWCSAAARGGLIVEMASRDRGPNVTINWREPDQAMV